MTVSAAPPSIPEPVVDNNLLTAIVHPQTQLAASRACLQISADLIQVGRPLLSALQTDASLRRTAHGIGVLTPEELTTLTKALEILQAVHGRVETTLRAAPRGRRV